MAKIIHNGVEYGGSGYSKNEIDRKLGLKLNKSSIDTEISEDSSNPVQNRVIAKAFKESQAIINVEELPTTNIKNTFYRFGYKGESQYIDVDATSEPNLERFDTVKQRFENAGFTVELKPDSSVHPKYAVTYPSEIYAYITPTVGYLIPTRIELVDVTNTQDQHEPELVVYYMQGTSETYTLRRANSPSVGSIFEYAESASPSLYAGNAEEQTVTKLDDGQSFIGTKAEWDALSQQEKNKYDGKIVNIIDDAEGENIDHYSTNEVKTNKVWIDGKPIYRKVVQKNVNLAGDSWNSTGIDVSEIDTLCNCVMLNSKFAFGGFYTKKNSNQLDVYCVSNANWGVATFILEYTKVD